MRSSGRRRLVRAFRGPAVAVALLLAMVAPPLRAQATQAAALYGEAMAREAALRKELASLGPNAPSEPLLRRIRVLVGSYRDLARLFPADGHSDNALWQGGLLAADAYRAFGDAVDRSTALTLLNALPARFPASSLARQVPAELARLKATPPRVTAPPSTTPPTSTLATTAMLTSVRRDVLADALRITLELEREVSFTDERLDTPARVFIDLQNARPSPALQDATIPFTEDLVKQIRVGRQIGSRTRIALDLTTDRRYSVYALYNPYRIIIDFERPKATAPPPVAAPLAPMTTSGVAPRTVAPPVPPPGSKAPPPAPVARIAPIAPGTALSLSRQLGLGIARIAIDPGHGGRDPGAKVKGLTESNLVLDVALRLEKLLKNQDVDVVLTRRTNEFVPLEERTAIANSSGADLFLSIHANASDTTTARGIETYFLNFAPNPEAEAIAARENAGSSRSMHDLADMVQAIAMNNKIDESRDFATIVQKTLYGRLRRVNKDLKNLGVKQAPFMVLIGATMPGILAEISFMTNEQEGALLRTDKYRQQIADALLAGIMSYQGSLKKLPVAAATQ